MEYYIFNSVPLSLKRIRYIACVTTSADLLGDVAKIIINDYRNCSRIQKKKFFKNTNRLANMTYRVIA